MNYTLCAISGIELVAGKRGQIFLTLRGYIKLSGKPKQTISERTTRGFLAGKVLETTALTVPGRGNRPCKLIPADLALEWLANDNPELAEAIGDDLVGFLQQGLDLSQFHKPKTKAVEIMPTTDPAPATNNLERYDKDGIELVIDRVTGEAWATQAGYARMSGLTQQAISYRTTTHKGGELKTAEVLTATGFKTHKLISAKLCFKWAIKDNPALAEAMGDAGATIYMHQLAGFKVTSDAIAKPEPEPTVKPTPQLTSAERVKLGLDLKSVIEFSGLDTSNPRFAQQIQDLFGDVLGLTQSALPAPTPKNGTAWQNVPNNLAIPSP